MHINHLLAINHSQSECAQDLAKHSQTHSATQIRFPPFPQRQYTSQCGPLSDFPVCAQLSYPLCQQRKGK